jgi:hypothetical protein
MSVKLEIGRDMILNRPFNGNDILTHSHARAVSKPKDMRINSLRWILPPHIQHHIRRLAPDPREAFERRTGIRHLAAILINKNTAEFDDVLSLIAE